MGSSSEKHKSQAETYINIDAIRDVIQPDETSDHRATSFDLTLAAVMTFFQH